MDTAFVGAARLIRKNVESFWSAIESGSCLIFDNEITDVQILNIPLWEDVVAVVLFTDSLECNMFRCLKG